MNVDPSVIATPGKLGIALRTLRMIAGLEAIIRENAFGRKRGRYIRAVPLSRVILASDMKREGDRWAWSGFAFVEVVRPHATTARLPDDLPRATLLLKTVRDRKYRSGLSRFEYAIMRPLAATYAYVMDSLFRTLDHDEWQRKLEEWRRKGWGQKKPTGQP